MQSGGYENDERAVGDGQKRWCGISCHPGKQGVGACPPVPSFEHKRLMRRSDEGIVQPPGHWATCTFHTSPAFRIFPFRRPQKVRCGPATLLQPRLPSHGLRRHLSSIHVRLIAMFHFAFSLPGL